MIIGTNFKLSSAKFLDDRQLCKDYATLIANAEGIIYPPGFEVFCEYENKYYQYVSDTNGGYIWEERKSGVSDGTIGASIKDDTISEDYTWSSAHIDSMRMDLENLITQANDYVDEIDERMLFIEGKFQWFEYFDGSYESLTDKPTIPTKVSELENDSEFIDLERLELERADIDEKLNQKIDAEEDRTLIPVTELERLSTLGNYNDTEIRRLIDELEIQSHTHINSDILDFITEEKINQWDNNTGVDDYNYIQNKPITRVGDDSDILLNFNEIIDEGMYIITAMVGEYKVHNELVHVKWSGDNNVTLTIPNMFMVLNANRTDSVWTIVNELYYGIDRENGKISDTLTIGEDKIILDKEGNGWFGGKVSQEGVPTEDKDLVTKGYVDERFTNYATNERIDAIDKENARRDVIIEALANGRKRTIETDGNDVDLIFSTEKDNVWIDKIEGDTMVNVCDQEEPIAITKSYIVEGTNHVPLQGEYDGKARPVVQGNTLVNHNIEYDKSIIIGERIDNIQGTEILNFEGTPNCEIKVDIDGHTAINLSTKKEDILCKSFDSASGNEINLVAEENSVSDLAIQGNTMVNLHPSYLPWVATNTGSSNFSVTTKQNYIKVTGEDNSLEWKFIYCGTPQLNMLKPSTTYTIVCTKLKGVRGFHFCATTNQHYIGAVDIDVNNNPLVCTFTTNDTIEINGQVVYVLMPDSGNVDIEIENFMIFEGDLTQTPELIPIEYVEGLKSTFEDKLIPYSIYNGDNLTSITETQYQIPLTIKSNTQYTVTTTANTTKYQYAVYSTDGLTEYLSYDTTATTQTFTCDTSDVYFKVRMNPSYEGDDYSFVLDEVKDEFLIVEGDWSGRLNLLTEEYFGKYRVDMSSCGKNLFDSSSFSPGALGIKNDYGLDINDDTSKYSQNYISVKSNTSYYIKLIGLQRIYFYDINKNWISRTELLSSTTGFTSVSESAFTTPNNCYYIQLQYYVSDLDLTNAQLEEGTQATEYEPYYGSSKTVYLNSPLLDGDELLTKDGKLYHYHKMGSVVFDGSEDESWTMANTQYTDTFSAYIGINDGSKTSSLLINNLQVSDKFEFDTQGAYNNGLNASSTQLIYRIFKSSLSTTDLAGFKQWLSENPTTVVYELAEPWYEEIGAYHKIILDGSEDENWDLSVNPDGVTYRNGLLLPSDKLGVKYAYSSDKVTIYCDKLPSVSFEDAYAKNVQGIGLWGPDDKATYLFISKGFTTVSQARAWLQQNPIIVIYELAEPQYIDEDTRFNIASNSTIEYQSNVPMANTTFLPYRNELPLLVSSTEYRVEFDCDVEGLELMVSLGGTSQTITSALHNELSFITPSLQTDGKLTIDGYGVAKIDNVLITSGNMEYKYFEGLKSGFEDGYLPNSMLTEFPSLESGNINSNTGEDMSSDFPIVRTPLLPVTSDKITFAIVNADYTLHKYVLYDNKGNFVTDGIELIDGMKLGVVTVSEGCSQFRLCLNASDVSAINQSNLLILEGDWTHLTEEDWSNLGKYKATIKIKNPNAPIFGKGGRL